MRPGQQHDTMPDVLTVREAAQRCKVEGLPVSEYTLRRWGRSGVIPTRQAGTKALIYWPRLVEFLTCTDGSDNSTNLVAFTGIRRADF